jgi:hypothetical protein
MILRIAAFLLPDGMSVIESNQPFTVRPMQRERVIESMRLLRRNRNPRDYKSNPVTAFGVHNQREAVQIEQRVESRFVLLHDATRLSNKDNHCNAASYEEHGCAPFDADMCLTARRFVTVDPCPKPQPNPK